MLETISVHCPACGQSEDIQADEELKIGYIVVKYQKLCEECIASDAEEREDD